MDDRQRLALAVFGVVPTALLILWLSRTRPEPTNCEGDYPAGRAAIVDGWLAGARPLLALGALAVIGMLLLVSRWRNASRPGRPSRAGTPTRLMVALLVPYAVACAIQTLFFLILGIPLLIAWAFWFVSIPVAAAASVWRVRRRPPDDRTWAAVQTIGWWALFAGVGGVAVMVGSPVTEGLCLS